MGRRKRKGRADIVVGAKMSGGGIHAGVVVGFVDEQSSGFPIGGPMRRFNGRVVLQGSNDKNQSWGNAVCC